MKSVLNATHSIRASKKSWILPGVLTNSVANTVCSKHSFHHRTFRKSALIGRFFILIWLLVVLTCLSFKVLADASNISGHSCRTPDYHETAKSRHVIDGDTIILADDRHVRLIGVNAPEIGRDGKASQAGAIRARNFLKQLLSKFQTVHLVYDKERYDRYQRTLAHLFLPDGTNIQAKLLRQGVTTPLTIPPNLTFLNCYRDNANSARNKDKGLWALPDYKPIPASKISSRDSGYRIIIGRVLRISDSSSAIWINLTPDVVLRIVREDLVYFNNIDLKELDGRIVQARGWLQHHGREHRMRIRHPVDLVVLPDVTGN